MSEPRSFGGARPFLHHLTQLLGVKESLLPSYMRSAAWLTARYFTSHTLLPERIISVLKTRARRKQHNDVLHILYFSTNVIRVIVSRRLEWVGHVARVGEKKNAYTGLVEMIEEKWPLGRGACEWVYADLIQLLSKGRTDGLLWIRRWPFKIFKIPGIFV